MGLEDLRRNLREKASNPFEKKVLKKLPGTDISQAKDKTESSSLTFFNENQSDSVVKQKLSEEKQPIHYYKASFDDLTREYIERRQKIDDAEAKLRKLTQELQMTQYYLQCEKSALESYQLTHEKMISESLDDDYDNLDGVDFEKYCQVLLTVIGFENVEMTPRSGDDGVDLVGFRDDVKYVFQCKRYKKNVGRSAVQEVYTGKSVYDADVAVVITTAGFTKEAQSTAGKLHVKLWDGERIKSIRNRIHKHKEWLDTRK